MRFIDYEIFFDCPFHGLENQVFCFRASDEQFNGRWVKYETIRERVEITQEEIDDVKENIASLYDASRDKIK